MSQDPNTGQISGISDDAHTALGQSADAWAKYLKVNKGKPDAGVANEMTQVYALLNDASGAAKAQRDRRRRPAEPEHVRHAGPLSLRRRKHRAGDAAAKKSVSLAPKSVRKQVKQQLDQTRAQAVKFKKQQAKAQKKAQTSTTPGGAPLQSPFGGLPSGP